MTSWRSASTRKTERAGILCARAVCVALLLVLPPVAADSDADGSRFLEARQALAAGRQDDYRSLRATLDDYPLVSYLDFEELNRRLAVTDTAAVAAFQDRYPDQVLSARLQSRWLDELARRGDWAALAAAALPEHASTATRCQHEYARWRSGNAEDWQRTAQLWLAARSRPRECDPLFQAWYADGGPPGDLAWQRFRLAIGAGESRLAAYLQRYLVDGDRARAARWLEIHRSPTTMLSDENASAELLAHGLGRLLTRQPRLAIAHYDRVAGRLATDDRDRLHRRITAWLASESLHEALDWTLARRAETTGDEATALRIRLALALSHWDLVTELIDGMAAAGDEARWRYWRERAVVILDRSPAAVSPVFAELAGERSYYGFLAADRLQRAYAMRHRPAQVAPDRLQALAREPAVVRARELHRLGLIHDARREWRSALRERPAEDLVAAGALAAQWAWHHQAIFAMIDAQYWDALELRFPLAYADALLAASRDTAISEPFLFAIARQESAFGADARSPAGAVGLMQLLPSTARDTARRLGLRYDGLQQLLQADTNVLLGSRYLDRLLDDFTDNRILAAAAYNAGPHRVRRWLERLPTAVDHDVFVETMPFYETRHYVQNVLAFAVIYGYRLGREQPLVYDRERRIAPADPSR